MKTHDSYMTNCMHQNIIKCIPYSFKTLRSRSVLQKVKFKITRELFIDYDLMLRLCDELFDFVIKFETDN